MEYISMSYIKWAAEFLPPLFHLLFLIQYIRKLFLIYDFATDPF